jgi:cell volume regulation protein A
MAIEYVILIGSTLVLVSIIVAKLSDNLGVPSLLLFLGVGMLAGSEGPGGIYFNDANLAQSVAVVALIFILFAGGLDTKWSDVKPIFRPAAGLATIGVLLTALIVGLFIHYVLNISLLTGLLLGAIISSTDAAAVFAVLRSKNVSLRGYLKPLLELESGSNDPMAIFLTIGLIQFINTAGTSIGSMVWLFIVQMSLGVIFGLALGKALVFVLNHLKIVYEGIYPVFALAFGLFCYGITTIIGGSGFLAVYVVGLVAANSEFIQKRSLLRFFDGLAWLSQITMFVTLGLLVFPSHIVPVIGIGLLISAFLMFIARPLSVFLTLIHSRFYLREKSFISWVGLRGAVPVILATFPLIAGVPDAEFIFNVVFFIVLTSALLQGSSIPFVARLLRLDAPLERKTKYPIEYSPVAGVDTELIDLTVPVESTANGKSVIELGMPRDSLIALISRNDSFLVPSGGTVIQEGDTILVLLNKNNLPEVRSILEKRKEPDGKRNTSV